jgi:hypothetical protein
MKNVFLSFCLGCLAVSALTFAGQANAWERAQPCSVSKQPFSLSKYGLSTPKGWSCFLPSHPNRLIEWKQGDKTADFTERDLRELLSPKEQKEIPTFGKIEPLRSIRMFVESFLADEKALATNEFWAKSAKQFLPKPKGILFSKNNEYTVNYGNSGIEDVILGSEPKETPVSFQTVMIFKKRQPYRHLDIETEGMSPDEVFSLLINPVIQK